MEQKERLLFELLNARNQDFQSELNIYMQMDKFCEMIEVAGGKPAELSGVKKFKNRLEKTLKKRYNVSDAELDAMILSEQEEGEE